MWYDAWQKRPLKLASDLILSLIYFKRHHSFIVFSVSQASPPSFLHPFFCSLFLFSVFFFLHHRHKQSNLNHRASCQCHDQYVITGDRGHVFLLELILQHAHDHDRVLHFTIFPFYLVWHLTRPQKITKCWGKSLGSDYIVHPAERRKGILFKKMHELTQCKALQNKNM